MKSSLVRSYLSIITMSPAAEGQDPMATLDHFNPSIESLRGEFTRNGDEKWVRLALKSLIYRPEGRIGAYRGQVFFFTDDELVTLFQYAYTHLWGTDPLDDDFPLTKVEIEAISEEEWAIEKSVQEELLDI